MKEKEYIYLLVQPEHRRYKIGHTKHPKDRIKELLKVWGQFDVELSFLFEVSNKRHKKETSLHHLLEDFRIDDLERADGYKEFFNLESYNITITFLRGIYSDILSIKDFIVTEDEIKKITNRELLGIEFKPNMSFQEHIQVAKLCSFANIPFNDVGFDVLTLELRCKIAIEIIDNKYKKDLMVERGVIEELYNCQLNKSIKQKEGIERAKAKGVYKGGTEKLNNQQKEEIISKCKELKVNKARIAREYDISRATLYKIINK